MDGNKLSDQLMRSVQSMIDPNATLEERLKQVQSQIAELSRLPDVIQKTLEDVKMQFEQLNQQVQQKNVEIQMSQSVLEAESHQQFRVSEQVFESKKEEIESQKPIIIEVTESENAEPKNLEPIQQKEIVHSVEEDLEIQNIIEKRRLEAESKVDEELMKERLSQELRLVRERLSPKPGVEGRSTPNLGLPERFAQNLGPHERSSPKLDVAGPAFQEPARPVTPKMWKKLDTYDDANLEQVLSETLAAQAEVIQGKAIGVNFKKYEKPPPPLDHLQHSEVYKAIHDMDQKPLKKVELLKPAIAASDYVERLRSVSPSPAKTFIEDCEV